MVTRIIDEKRGQEMGRKDELKQLIAELTEELAWWDAELEAADIEDATEWEHFPEMERVLYELVWFELKLERIEHDEEITAEIAERDELVEFIELAEEAARVELAEFGCVAIETGLSDAEWDKASPEFWEFACDLWDEPKSYVLTELF